MMIFVKRIMLCLSFLLANSLCFAQLPLGQWQGEVTQDGPDDSQQHYQVMLLVKSEEEVKIDYPSLQCGGILHFIKAVDQTNFYREEILYGQAQCLSGGLFTITQENNQLLLSWKMDITVKGKLNNIEK